MSNAKKGHNKTGRAKVVVQKRRASKTKRFLQKKSGQLCQSCSGMPVIENPCLLPAF